MMIFGGIHAVTQELDDICALDLSSNRWHQVQQCSQIMVKVATRSKSPIRKLTDNLLVNRHHQRPSIAQLTPLNNARTQLSHVNLKTETDILESTNKLSLKAQTLNVTKSLQLLPKL
jgi:hypothetical protein